MEDFVYNRNAAELDTRLEQLMKKGEDSVHPPASTEPGESALERIRKSGSLEQVRAIIESKKKSAASVLQDLGAREILRKVARASSARLQAFLDLSAKENG